jgi:hypothetical protein
MHWVPTFASVSHCGHAGPKRVALMTLCSFDLRTAGSQRRAPTGGSANGMPRNWAMFGVVSLMKPCTGPDVVSAIKQSIACTTCQRPNRADNVNSIAKIKE